MPLKSDTKKNPFCMSYTRFFLKYGLHNNHWVGHSLMKPVDAVVFHKIKSMRGFSNDEINNFEM